MTDITTEHRILDGLLVLAFAIAPHATNHFFLDGNRNYARAHRVALTAVVASSLAGSGLGSFAWATFCVYGIVLFLRRERANLWSPTGFACGIPFAFSAVSAVWFVGGANELHLLGYSRAFSFYAALHGSVLGWLFVACTAQLARRSATRRLHLAGCYLVFALFLCVAFGIDGVPHLKRVGVIGYSLVVPTLIARYALDQLHRGGAPLILALASLSGITLSMAIAVANEFWLGFPRTVFGMPTMVLTHGILNAVVVVPCFAIALLLELGPRRSTNGERPR